jgi:ClpP class serine protease
VFAASSGTPPSVGDAALGHDCSMSDAIWIIVLAAVALLVFVPFLQRHRRTRRRRALIQSIERHRGSRLISMIHRQESLSILGIPLTRFIDIEDSEQILRAIRLTPRDMPIDLVLHTPGGLVLAADQIAYALQRHPGRVTVIVPHYAMSGGTLVALSADEIVMDPDAVLGPVDPQLGSLTRGYWPAASILSALETDNPNRDDQTLILADMARKAIAQVHATVYELLVHRRGPEEAKRVATLLSEGRWTHDYPIRLDEAKQIGLPVREDVPQAVYELMTLYPQRSQRRPSVEFIPMPYRQPGQQGHV